MPLLERSSALLIDPLRGARQLIGLRASPNLLALICVLQLLALVAEAVQEAQRPECALLLSRVGGQAILDCGSCVRFGMDLRDWLRVLVGVACIGSGVYAVHQRDQRMLFIYGSSMTFFASVVGLTALLTSFEVPVIEAALDSARTLQPECSEVAAEMLADTRDVVNLCTMGAVLYGLGAVLAFRSKELFTYQEVASSHAEVTGAQTL